MVGVVKCIDKGYSIRADLPKNHELVELNEYLDLQTPPTKALGIKFLRTTDSFSTLSGPTMWWPEKIEQSDQYRAPAFYELVKLAYPNCDWFGYT